MVGLLRFHGVQPRDVAGGYTQSGVGSDEGPRSRRLMRGVGCPRTAAEPCAGHRPERWRETIPRRHVNHR